MWISNVKLKGVKCFVEENIALSKGINVLVGENNSGKSTVLQALRTLQYTDAFSGSDRRIGAEPLEIEVSVEENGEEYFPRSSTLFYGIGMRILKGLTKNNEDRSHEVIMSDEPDNFIYPYYSNRKVVNYSQDVGSNFDQKVTGNHFHLNAKVDRISNSTLHAHKEYVRACNRILEFTVMTSSAKVGKYASYTVSDRDNITVGAMGDGVPNILGLILDLCYAKPNRLFLIEEPENDIHPKALKELLELIIEKSESHQFVITTHSNIVVRYLASVENSKLYEVNTRIGEDKLFTSEVKEIEKDATARRSVLERLGYESVDFEKWDGWLFLEESSAEIIIRDHLFRWFVPEMEGRIKTYSAHSVSEVKKRFDEFNRLFAFLNMEPVYKNKAWVIVDGGKGEEQTRIKELEETYGKHGWSQGQFIQFEKHDFEEYYPEEFKEKVKQLGSLDKGKKWEAKKKLLEDVKLWIGEDDERAKKAFETSAADVISKVRKIKSDLGL